jgi:acetoacetate decarboxylase
MNEIRFGRRDTNQPPDVVAQETNSGGQEYPSWATIEAVYETDPDIVAAILPPPLEPSATGPLVRVNISVMEMGSFRMGAATFNLKGRHRDVEGEYTLCLPMTTEQAVIGGREIFGEPKKIADIAVERDGYAVVGTVTRMGVTYLELRGNVVEQLVPPPPREQIRFFFKFLLSPDGSGGGFDAEPTLVYGHADEVAETSERVEGEVVLRESQFDPVADVVVKRLLSMEYTMRAGGMWAEVVEKVPAADFLPYVHQRYDNYQPAPKRVPVTT